MRRVLLDTGPLVAILSQNDYFHHWAEAQFRQIKLPVFTCESVLSEACFLLHSVPSGRKAVLDLVSRGHVRVPYRVEDDVASVALLVERYASVPMSLADACLVRMAEQIGNTVVLTLDSDFKLYRMHGRRVIPTIMPTAL